MIALGILLLILGYLLPGPLGILTTIGWILVIVGLIMLVLGSMGRPIGGRRYWY